MILKGIKTSLSQDFVHILGKCLILSIYGVACVNLSLPYKTRIFL